MTFKAPTRRALAVVHDREVVPALKGLTNNTAFLKRQLDNHWDRLERMDAAACRFRSMNLWQRVKWLVLGKS